MEPPAHAFDPGRIPDRGDHQLAPMLAPSDGSLHRPAAVLIPVVAHPENASILLTRRASHLRDHSGQIAFPGGKIDEADPSPMAAAIREAGEEIGLAPDLIQPLGYLDAYLTSTGFRVVPVLSLVTPDYALELNPNEVDIVFETPLSFLMDPGNHQRHTREWKGSQRQYYAMPYGEHYIWGVTAGILRNLYERLYAE
ncbi:CoA pyrophosphatase [Alsobacter soli]|uniref:CoA pyrophosphatase n=2 Tax=Alsobacter soli TaxID=2109933 RepID=A0A2T1HZS5_9HYPH|nr:CoA pyrophosphatase [Alsobacter soli]